MNSSILKHPLGSKAKILLTSVFGPYARDDEYGSRKINPMELYHNQVTREQGPFSLRMFHRSFGLILIKENLDAPCTLLDFPDLDRFIEEISHNAYDIVGISSIMPNIGKVKKMCELIRTYLPHAAIVIGGHIASVPDLAERVDTDHICRGDGVRWFRKFLGLDENAPIKHPCELSAFGTRILGIRIKDKPKETAAILIPSAGCPVGCNFCSTSALFGGKGKFVNFYETGDDLYAAMCTIEKKLNVSSFFILDENFLLHRTRALKLLELMKANNKAWSLFVFSSARVLRSYTIEQLVRLGISWVWMGIEGEDSNYSKLGGIDTKELVQELQSHGIRVLGSSIIGLENHTPEKMDDVIEYAASHNTVFHQFMLYTPIPGTPLHEKLRNDGTLLPEVDRPAADNHGQYRFNYCHEHIKNGSETEFLCRAFRRDFEVNGPSLARMIRVMLVGWKRYKNHTDPCIRKRFHREMKDLGTTYCAAAWAMKRWYKNDREMRGKIGSILRDAYREFGWKSRILAPIMGIFAYLAIGKEQKRLDRGWTYEPPIFYEKNARALELESLTDAEPCAVQQGALMHRPAMD
ncbi:MAG TPA: cobalamin-dependent protein [Deltaproteobacteria bacterium]|mgnify:CR=1 FL=1|nr:cobalamin-dependent protein [Deltaproteobacteria bacterium]HQJ08622.1 cobalamin-dependent protein [Deltaproteobacteria bacterium]